MSAPTPHGRLTPTREQELVRAALEVRDRAWAPYSRFQVGAALLCDDGAVVLGCNVENASYGLCVCAERTAVASAVASGRTGFRAIVVATGSVPPSPPCGMCRQVLAEFCSDLRIVCVNPEGQRLRTTLRKLFPGTFTPELLRSGQGTRPRGAGRSRSRKGPA